VPSRLRRYAFAQARIRGRLARLVGRRELEALSALDAAGVLHELEARGDPHRTATLLTALGELADMLDGAPREVLARYRDRVEWENIAVLLRAVERGLPAEDVMPLLHPVGALGAPAVARPILEAADLAEAVARLPAQPYGDLLRRVASAAPRGAVERLRLEAVAEREAWERVWRPLEGLDAEDRRSAARVLGTKLDCVNLLRFLRLRVEHGLAPEELLALAIRAGHRLGMREREELAHALPAEWSSRLAHTPYAAALAAWEHPAAVEGALYRQVARAAVRELAGPPFCIGLALAYAILLETQAADLRRVLEGRRLGRSTEWIAAGLVAARGA
jgi:vacuolar-type H+-ATPase subunit C/Vma6